MIRPAARGTPDSRWSRWRRRLRWLAVTALLPAAALPAALGGVAQAYWSSNDSSNPARAAADSLPAGATPTATATSTSTVTVSFARAVTVGGRDVTDYTVRRYPSPSGSTAAATFTCSWASGGTLGCTDTGVAGGIWYYTDAPIITGSSWSGAESARSTGAATDTTPPTVSVTSITPAPNGNGYHNSSPVTVNLTATDDAGGAGVASITYWVDAGTHSTVTAATASVPVAGDGTHTVSFFATDGAANASGTSAQTVRIDTLAPGVATITSYPNPVNIANRTSVAVSGTAEANSTVTLTIADAASAHTVTRTATANGSGAWSATGIDVSSLNDGTITYRATATDEAGNTGAPASVTASKDTIAPTVGISAATNPVNSGTVATATATASGTVSGGTVVLTVTDGTHTVSPSVNSNGSTWSSGPINLSTLTDGTITYAATATDPAGNPATATATASKDTAAPTVTALAIGPVANASTGSIRKSGSYYVYANAADTSPGAVASVTANVGVLTSGATAIALTSTGGPFTAGGVTYAYRSAVQTAGSGLTAGSKAFTATATDTAGNVSAIANGSVNIDTVGPAPSNMTLANHTGGIVGKPETSDTITFTYSEEMDPHTLYSGWDWANTPDVTTATVIFQDNPSGNGTNRDDSLTVNGPAGVNLGTVTNLEGHLVTTPQGSYIFTATLHYAVTSGQSTVTVTLGSLTSGGTGVGTTTSTNNVTWSWTPPGTETDLATNAITGSVTKSSALPF
jgi:hypothetical protein